MLLVREEYVCVCVCVTEVHHMCFSVQPLMVMWTVFR